MENKLLVTDLDGTFVKDSKQVAPKDKKLFISLKGKLHLGIATGRSVKEIDFIEEQIGFKINNKIGFNGGLIVMEGQKIFEKFIETPILRELLYYIQENQLVYDALDGKNRIGTYQSGNQGRIWNVPLVKPEDMIAEIAPLRIYKINVRPEAGRCTSTLLDLQNKFPQLSICKSGPERIEITPADITKGQAIERIKQIQPLEVITVGDSENDISMFELADTSFCLRHAASEVRNTADHVIDDFYEIAQYL
ncbi:sugar phosphate phosphatase [Tetragenococcus halophilus]|uniref:Cof-type HAD-IIB family hydrolase n=1 Tax=Tetragenococcus halophilus TaxID=51669 RepID=UPI0019296240|nr:Cof-type HAD-IIB family hydrolase [Tetragenococcus halophilus]MDN6270903.1 Cof-type HAD-IIB family hydrolase [Tetragenococcus koreensis]MCF1676455.1 Cof-type HAD-IIB family hydrolase [Tetragenococcus halophilus]MDN6128846.1 Cof-type HAD-IIB family hydrolase [Tetragenococcus halophilus]MDN6508916.1 Cof-type HAD-IIB family hydrolase [Tetragenococcus halophilus]MDN6527251.1 Cof-type HAD-IIB family hydrolase [Tetragenococcus halophilus]